MWSQSLRGFHAAMKPMNCKTMISGPGVVRRAQSVNGLRGVSHAAESRSFASPLRDVGQHGVSAAESDERGLREKAVLLCVKLSAAPRRE